MKILGYITTYNRYDSTLSMCLLSMIMQTRKPDHITIFDDNKEPRDLREVEHYKYLFDLMTQKGIEWNYIYAHKKGAHYSHEMANLMTYDLAWFLDDDQVAESTCLEELEKEMKDGVGAVGGLILKPPATGLPAGIDGKLDDVFKGQNIAWYRWSGEPREVEHLYSSFLYRCGIIHHDIRLSKKVFRGETMFTHSFFLKGYKLIITPKAVTWHFEGAGGCRTEEEEKTNQEMYDHDEQIFHNWLSFQNSGKKLYVLDNGLGDHFMFKSVMKLPDNALLAVCYPEVFPEYELISIAQAKAMVDIEPYNIYKWCAEHNWKGHLKDAFPRLYADIN
jgi:hypothetical protein